jgi:hypothetical protein
LREEAGITGVRGALGPFVPAGALGPRSLEIGPWDVRAALNATASYPSWTDWDPTTNVSARDLGSVVLSSGNLTTPVLPVLAASQVGWGLVHAAEADAALELLLEYARSGDSSVLSPDDGEKGEENAAFMRAGFAAREEYWGAKTGT